MQEETEQYQAKAESGLKTSQMSLGPKPWKNKSIEEKLEALRESQQDIRRSLSYTANNAQRAREIAQNHEHSYHTGKAVIEGGHTSYTGDSACLAFDPLA